MVMLHCIRKIIMFEEEKKAINDIITLGKEIGFEQGIHINHISTEGALFLIHENRMQMVLFQVLYILQNYLQ